MMFPGAPSPLPKGVHLRQRWVNAECSAPVGGMLWSTALAEAGSAGVWSRWMVGVAAAGSWTGGGERDSGRQDRTDVGAEAAHEKRTKTRQPIVTV